VKNKICRPAQGGEKIQKQFLSQSKWEAASTYEKKSVLNTPTEVVFFPLEKKPSPIAAISRKVH
jgi:hypothetical protein